MPSAAEQLVMAERESRDAARARLDQQVGRLRSDIEQRGIGGWIADEASSKALAALDEASLVASESKGIIGGALVLLLMWFFRTPIMSAFEAMLDESAATKGHKDDDDG
jgi:hypothetical protein